MPELPPTRLAAIAAIEELAKLAHVDEAALSEERQKAIEDLLQDREVLQARIRELERFIETEEQP